MAAIATVDELVFGARGIVRALLDGSDADTMKSLGTVAKILDLALAGRDEREMESAVVAAAVMWTLEPGDTPESVLLMETLVGSVNALVAYRGERIG